MQDPSWLNWPIGMIGFVPPSEPITEELLRMKVAQALEAGASVLAFPCEAEGYALWPTELLPQVPNAALPDVFGTLLKISHENNLRVLAHWMGVHCQSSFWDRHSDWLQRNSDNELIQAVPGGLPWPALCLNSPFGDYLLSEMEEILKRYPVDGIYCDGLYQRFTGCYCNACGELYHQEHGGSMPTNSQTPPMRKFREDTVLRMLSRLRGMIKATSPEVPFILDTVGPTLGWLRGENLPRMAEYVDHFLLESYWDVRRQPLWSDGMEAQVCKALTDRRVWSPRWLARSPDHELVSNPEATIRAWMGQSLVNGLPPFALEQNLFQVDSSLLPLLNELNQHSREAAPYLAEAHPIAQAALVYPYETLQRLGPRNGLGVLEAFQGAYLSLLRNHIPFKIITERQLRRGDLGEVDTIVFPNTLGLGDKCLRTITDFVSKGGGLVVTHRTGDQDERGNERDRSPLTDLTGVEMTGILEAAGPRGVPGYGGADPAFYARVEGNHPIGQNLAGRLISFAGTCMDVKIVSQGEVPVYRLDYDPEVKQNNRFFNWYPGKRAGPLIIARQIAGDGRVATITADLTRSYWLFGWPELAQLFAQSVSWTTKRPAQINVVSHHPLVEVRGYKNDPPGPLVIVLTNLATNEAITLRGGGFPLLEEARFRSHPLNDIVPQNDIRLKVRIPTTLEKRVRPLISKTIASRKSKEFLDIVVPRLEAYEVLIIE